MSSTTYRISNLVHGDIDPKDPDSDDWTPILKVAKSQTTWQLVPTKDGAYNITLNAKTTQTLGNFERTEEYLGAIPSTVTNEQWFITKNNQGYFMIHRAAGGARIHAHWELSSSDVGTKVLLEGGHDHGKSSSKLGKFLERVVQPNSGITLDDYEDDIDKDAFWIIKPAPF